MPAPADNPAGRTLRPGKSMNLARRGGIERTRPGRRLRPKSPPRVTKDRHAADTREGPVPTCRTGTPASSIERRGPVSARLNYRGQQDPHRSGPETAPGSLREKSGTGYDRHSRISSADTLRSSRPEARSTPPERRRRSCGRRGPTAQPAAELTAEILTWPAGETIL
jgi:hypothetical protein